MSTTEPRHEVHGGGTEAIVPRHHEGLTQNLIGAAIEVHRRLGPGLLESPYRRCPTHELRLGELPVESKVAPDLQCSPATKGSTTTRHLLLRAISVDSVAPWWTVHTPVDSGCRALTQSRGESVRSVPSCKPPRATARSTPQSCCKILLQDLHEKNRGKPHRATHGQRRLWHRRQHQRRTRVRLLPEHRSWHHPLRRDGPDRLARLAPLAHEGSPEMRRAPHRKWPPPPTWLADLASSNPLGTCFYTRNHLPSDTGSDSRSSSHQEPT